MKSRGHVCVAAARLEEGLSVALEASLGPGRAAEQQTSIRRGRCVHFGVWKLPVWIEHYWWLIHLSDLYCGTHPLNIMTCPPPESFSETRLGDVASVLTTLQCFSVVLIDGCEVPKLERNEEGHASVDSKHFREIGPKHRWQVSLPAKLAKKGNMLEWIVRGNWS